MSERHRRRPRGARTQLGSEHGASTTELVLITPVLISLLLLVALTGRIAMARADVVGAARDAARAASLVRASGAAEGEARTAAEASLLDRGITCSPLDVVTDVGDFRAGGTVAVDVRCTVDLRSLALLAIPGSRTVEARAVEVIDVYRGLDEEAE